MKKVVVCDHIHQDGIDILKAANDIELVIAYDQDKETLLTTVSDANLVITRSSTPVNEKFLNATKSLEYIIRAGVGVDNVDIEGCSKLGIVVMNVPTANTIAAVELTMTHMLSCMRTFPYAHGQLKNERVWKRENWYGNELNGKTLGVIGFGNIGSRVAIRSKAFDMNVVAFDPYISSSKVTDLGMTYTTNFDDILNCDLITIHTPKNKETLNMIGKEEIAKMRDGVILINCARGGLYNEDALVEGLKSGKVKFAGIDVFASEPATDHPLLDLDNVTVTPHLGANTKESQVKIATQAANNALDVARGISFPNAMNLPIKEGEVPSWAEPYFELTQRLSYVASKNCAGAIKSITVEANGELVEYLDSLTTFALH
jgi:D-3-phosphoglycerate dehydrogenase